jgi:hypothetical protein
LNFGNLPKSANVTQCQRCQVKVGHGRKFGDSLWNRVAISCRLKVISSSGLVTAILNPQSATSADIDINCHIQVGLGRKREADVGIMSLCHWKLKFYRLAENNIRFFHVGCPWFSRSLSRYWKEQHSHGERRNMRNWTFWKQVFDLIFKFTRQSQKYLKRFAHTPTPALRRLINCLHATNAKDGD